MRCSFLVAALLSSAAEAFVPLLPHRIANPSHGVGSAAAALQMEAATSTSAAAAAASKSAAKASIVIVSPPGGVGEVAAVESACLGSTVRWFVVSDETSASVTLAPEMLQQIQDAGGSLDLAGATVEDLTANVGGEALQAVSKWCGAAVPTGLICTYDGCGEGGEEGSAASETRDEYIAALRLAAQQAAKGVMAGGPKVAILAANQDLNTDGKEESDSVFSKVAGLFRDSPTIPPTMERALLGDNNNESDSDGSNNNVYVLRHGELFGLPESSPNFSPMMGGPKRDPVLAEEYTMRNVRIDPFRYSGNTMGSTSARSCRHALGEAAALLVTGTVPAPTNVAPQQQQPQQLILSSQLGTDAWDVEQWKKEFDRVQRQVDSGQGSELFTQALMVGSEPEIERLADWLATKWAPAVMRTYDIAAIRIGARPVYATRAGPGRVEITWQQLVKYDPVLVGKLLVSVTPNGISATRGAGDASKGFGSVSQTPLPGEDVLVRRLAEACSQAVDKGLAKKIQTKKKAVVAAVPAPKPVTSMRESGSVETVEAGVPSSPSTPATGPRQAGARRSTPRTRRGSTSTTTTTTTPSDAPDKKEE
jgi:hypothetical protein